MNDSPVDCQSRGKALPAGKEVLLPLPKKERNSRFVLFLSNPKDWYVISRERVCNLRPAQYGITRQRVSLLRIDAIHGVAVIPSSPFG